MFFDLFSERNREIKKSIEEYNRCYAHYKGSLAGFRSNAQRELTLAYPDIVFLLNEHCDRFFGYSKRSGVTCYGLFADRIIHKIDFVADDENIEKRLAAVKTYKSRESTLHSLTRMDKGPLWNFSSTFAKSLRSGLSSDLRNKGFGIIHSIENDLIVGAQLKRGEDVIVSEDCWHPILPGTFATKLIDEVVRGGPGGHDGIDAITLTIYSMANIQEHSTFEFQIVYDSRQNFSSEAGFRNFKNIFSGLTSFLNHIEQEFRQPPSTLTDEDDMECAKEWLSLP